MHSSQHQVRNLFEKLRSWREVSQKEFSIIVDMYSNSITKSTNDLIGEVGDLKVQLSAIKKENNNLLETVNNVSAENRQLRAQILLIQDLPGSEQNCNHDSEEGDLCDTEELHLKRPIVNTEVYKSKTFEDCGYIADPTVPLNENDQNNFSKTVDADANNIDEEVTEDINTIKNQELHMEDHICPKCNFPCENLDIHLNNIHSEFDLNNINQSENEEIEPNCDSDKREETIVQNIKYSLGHGAQIRSSIQDDYQKQHLKHVCYACGYVSSKKSDLKMHIKQVHEKIRDHACTECEFTASQKNNLKAHIERVHENKKKYFCAECGYAATSKGSLKKHTDRVHHQKIRNHICRECGYAASEKGTLKQHIEHVHEKIKSQVCAECGYASSRKGDLKKHIEEVHKKIKNHKALRQIQNTILKSM